MLLQVEPLIRRCAVTRGRLRNPTSADDLVQTAWSGRQPLHQRREGNTDPGSSHSA